MSIKTELDPIEEAISAIRNGEVIIVVDDEDRENEGDFICAAEKITPEIVNFMATHGRGLICAPLVAERCEELGQISPQTHHHYNGWTQSTGSSKHTQDVQRVLRNDHCDDVREMDHIWVDSS